MQTLVTSNANGNTNTAAVTRTITLEQGTQSPQPDDVQSHGETFIVGSLSLSAQQDSEERPRVRWSDDTIDNEHLNKKKSKSNFINLKE